MITTILSVAASASYLLAAGLLGRLFIFDNVPSGTRKVALSIGRLAVLLHAGALGMQMWQTAGLAVGFFQAAGLVGWIASLLVLIAARRDPIESAGTLLFPVTALALLAEVGIPTDKLVGPDVAIPVAVHILASVLAYSFFILAALQALVLAIQDRRLRSKNPLGFSRRLPPIPVMENLLFQWIVVGFVLLTVGLAVGWNSMIDLRGQHLTHKAVFSCAAWVIFAVLLFGRFRFGWRGRTATRWTFTGFAFLLLAYFGSKFVLELVLQRA